MRFLFYFVHPAKYHLFKVTINELKKNHQVDIVIKSKDVLEDLIKKEGWDYTNLIPYKSKNYKTRKKTLYKSFLNFLISIVKLELYLIKNIKYDVFVTDDALVVNGWFRKIKTYLFVDNDFDTLNQIKILFYFTKYVISPASTNLGKFENKKISFKGNKALAYLHKHYFKPDKTILQKYNLDKSKYIIIRTAKLDAIHDRKGYLGLDDNILRDIIYILRNKFKIIISSERVIEREFSEYLFQGEPNDLIHLMAYAELFIGDSGSMATEAAMLGVPNILINELALKTSLHKELINENLQICLNDGTKLINLLKDILENENYKSKYNIRLNKYLEKCDDFNDFFLKLLSNK